MWAHGLVKSQILIVAIREFDKPSSEHWQVLVLICGSSALHENWGHMLANGFTKTLPEKVKGEGHDVPVAKSAWKVSLWATSKKNID